MSIWTIWIDLGLERDGKGPLMSSCPYLPSFRIQNMRMIDGKPEYQNGLVRNQSLGLELHGGKPGEGGSLGKRKRTPEARS